MNGKRVGMDEIHKIKQLRERGHSINEISEKLDRPKTTIFRYIQNVSIMPKFLKNWTGKRGGSRKIKLLKEEKAFGDAKKLIRALSSKEKLLFLCALYWAEGNKKDFILTNSDPNLIKVFISGLRDILLIPEDKIQVSLRIYEDIGREESLSFWSKIVKIPEENFLAVHRLCGRKKGKLTYGMCRIRVRKGEALLKKIDAVNKVVVNLMSL